MAYLPLAQQCRDAPAYWTSAAIHAAIGPDDNRVPVWDLTAEGVGLFLYVAATQCARAFQPAVSMPERRWHSI